MKTLNTKGGRIMFMPTVIEDLTLGQFLALRRAAPDDAISLVSILCRIPLEELLKEPYDAKKYAELSVMAAEISEAIRTYFSEANEAARMKTPDSIIVGDKEIKVPEDLNRYAYWATRRALTIIQLELETRETGGEFDPTNFYDELLAHYLYCPYTEMKYDEKRADEFVVIVNEIPLIKAIPLANFIMLGLSKSWRPSRINLVKTLIMTSVKPTRQALKYLGQLLRSTASRKETSRNGTRSKRNRTK